MLESLPEEDRLLIRLRFYANRTQSETAKVLHTTHLGGIIGKETASWLCLLVAAPVAIAGFFHYNGMSLEQFLWAFVKSEILCAGPRRFDSVNLHEEVFASIMEDTLE